MAPVSADDLIAKIKDSVLQPEHVVRVREQMMDWGPCSHPALWVPAGDQGCEQLRMRQQV